MLTKADCCQETEQRRDQICYALYIATMTSVRLGGLANVDDNAGDGAA